MHVHLNGTYCIPDITVQQIATIKFEVQYRLIQYRYSCRGENLQTF